MSVYIFLLRHILLKPVIQFFQICFQIHFFHAKRVQHTNILSKFLEIQIFHDAINFHFAFHPIYMLTTRILATRATTHTIIDITNRFQFHFHVSPVYI